MRTIHVSRIGAIFFAFVLIASIAFAAEQKITLQPGPDGNGASGDAIIKDKGSDQKEIAVDMKGLKPDSVYTVWFVNEKPKMDMAGVGKPDYEFKSDGQGAGQYTATVSTAKMEKWQLLEIALHPDGDPKNMDNMKIALKGEIKGMGPK